MVIGHEITHGFDDNGEKITQKAFFQLHSLHYKKLKLHTAVTEGSMRICIRTCSVTIWDPRRHAISVLLNILQ